MRIIQTVNDTIRLLFNPKTEVFSLSDFLLVRDNSENFLAQVVEVYDDKFDQEANVAKIKLIYRIINGNEIVPYDNYTPSRECEVAKIKQSEIEKCINLNKKTIPLGVSFKTKEKTEINTDFFDNNCVIFADKYEQTNQIFENLAPRLAEYKHVLILDFSGSCIPENAVSYTASDNFRIPLSSDTIDYIQQKTLLRAKLETQVVLGDVFEEVKNYLSSTEEDYIPFSRFIKVIQSQCRQTPAVELLVLISWLKKYARHGIFAKNIREAESLFKSVEKNKITTLDLSSLKIEWQKEYVEYITKKIKKDVFVLIRLNDNNINNDIINSIYFKCKNISFIPSFAYGYKKVSYIMDFAQNYILMPTLNPKRDFTHATFQIQSLNKESYMIFGEDTKDFIFILENASPVKRRPVDEDDSRDKMFISLNLQLEDMTALELRPNNFEVKPTEIKKKRLQEEIRLEDVLKVQDKTENEEDEQKEPTEETVEAAENSSADGLIIGEIPTEEETYQQEPEQEEPAEGAVEGFIEIPEEEIAPESVLGEDELDFYGETEEQSEEYTPSEYSEETQETNSYIEEAPQEAQENVEYQEQEQEQEQAELVYEEAAASEEVIEAEVVEETEDEQNEPEPEEGEKPVSVEEEQPEQEDSLPKIKDTAAKLVNAVSNAELAQFAEAQSAAYSEEDEEDKGEVVDDTLLDAIDEANGVKKQETRIEEAEDVVSSIVKETIKEKAEMLEKEETEAKSKAEVSNDEPEEENAPDDEVKAEASQKEEKEPEEEDDESEEKAEEADKLVKAKKAEKEAEAEEASDKEDKEDSKEAEKEEDSKAEESKEDEIDKKFNEIIKEEQAQHSDGEMLKINDKVSIDLDKIKKEVKKKEPKLPVFNDDEEEAAPVPVADFKEGDNVFCEKYGKGVILKIMKFSDKPLLHIEFEEFGKRLLDPKMAKVRVLEDV